MLFILELLDAVKNYIVVASGIFLYILHYFMCQWPSISSFLKEEVITVATNTLIIDIENHLPFS